MANKADLQILKWLAKGDTGRSSETLAFWAGFGILPAEHSHPHDPWDFQRCLQLLRAAPSLVNNLPMMAKVSIKWAKLIKHWSELEKLIEDEIGVDGKKSRTAPKTYARMKEILG